LCTYIYICTYMYIYRNDVVNSGGKFKLALPRGMSHESFIAAETLRSLN
jgi:hypothetical protein